MKGIGTITAVQRPTATFLPDFVETPEVAYVDIELSRGYTLRLEPYSRFQELFRAVSQHGYHMLIGTRIRWEADDDCVLTSFEVLRDDEPRAKYIRKWSKLRGVTKAHHRLTEKNPS